MAHKQYKCQTQGKESYIDNQFVIFSQSYLITAIQKFIKGKKIVIRATQVIEAAGRDFIYYRGNDGPRNCKRRHNYV